MTLPSIIFGIVISSLYGAIFHLYRGGGFGHLLLYLIMAWFGFWIGHLIGNNLGWTFLSLGPLNLGMATISAAIMMVLGYWLSLVDLKNK
jgi:hypothetical protein